MRKYGLIGFPLEHSFSKSYFEKKFNKLQIKNVNYENYELENINEKSNNEFGFKEEISFNDEKKINPKKNEKSKIL